MPETDELRIFEADPKRVVSVTVGELRRLYMDGCETVHERTCHFYCVDTTEYDVGPNFVEPDGEWRCSACGEAPDVGTQEQIDSLMADYYPSAIPEAIPVCPNCGARVVE